MFLKLLLVFGISFFSYNLYDSFKKWNNSKNYPLIIKGTIDNIKIIENKLYFIIKWHCPIELQNEEKIDTLFYEHFVKNVPSVHQSERDNVLSTFITKYIDKPFALQLKVENLSIKDIQPFRGNFMNVMINFFIMIILLGILSFISLNH